jgi:uncharacterized protein YoxC
MFWMMLVIALSFIVIAFAMVLIAVFVSRAVRTVNRLEEKLEPLVDRVAFISDQGKHIAVQSRQIAEQFNAMANHLSTASMHFSESLSIIKGEVTELTEVVGEVALEAREKVELVSRTIDRTHQQVAQTTDLIQTKVVEPARELGAIMAGFRRGLEVLVAPAPKPINQIYGEDEMFIG